MKLRLHYEQPAKNLRIFSGGQLQEYSGNYVSEGVVILEAEPQSRTINFLSHSGTKRVNFPHLLFTFRFFKNRQGKFDYPGIFNSGMRVCCSNEAFHSLDGRVFYHPIELDRKGLVCTPHEYDHMEFDTLQAMASKMLNIWWGLQHHSANVNATYPAGSYLDFLENTRVYVRNWLQSWGENSGILLDTLIPRNTPILDENFSLRG